MPSKGTREARDAALAADSADPERLGYRRHRIDRSRRKMLTNGLALDAVDGASSGFPCVVGGARAVRALVRDDPRVSAHLLGALSVPEQVRVVPLLPDEDQVCRGHEVGDERAAGRGARKRVRAHAEPPAVVATVVLLPELLVRLEVHVGQHNGTAPRLRLHRGHNSHMPAVPGRDVGIVLSGGGINGILLELGFLTRLRESPVWPRVGWIYGTSAGALSGVMAALDRLEDLEDFLLHLQPEEVFRPRRVWQFPGGLHDYTLPETIAERLGEARDLGAGLAASAIELVVFATDVSEPLDGDEAHHFELVFSSRSTSPETMGRAILASAAVSGLVLPVSVGGVIATDGGWIRNFPLEHAYRNPEVQAIAAFRYLADYRPADVAFLGRMRERLERFRAVPPVRALLAEIRLAEERAGRGEPAHYAEMIVRLMRVAIARNTVLEERLASERDTSVLELQRLRQEVTSAALNAAPKRKRDRLRVELDQMFAAARFPFRHDRHVPSMIVRATPGADGLDPTFRGDEPWPEERKRALIGRGYRMTDDALAVSAEFES